MSNEQIKNIIKDSYYGNKEETLRSMANDFYSRELLSTAILVWAWAILFIGLATYSAIQFFRTDQIRERIMYATLFILGAHGMGLIKVFAWAMVHQHSIKREIKRLELRVVELTETLKRK
jgi:hypothetical protein